MDFLDPRRRRNYHIKLMIGYGLMAIVIVLATIILVYGAYGYSLNTKTGDVVQNGLLFLDSQPAGAKIYLNDKDINATTSSRLILPAGDYSVVLKKDGYRQWRRNFVLDEHNIARYVYPFLFPVKVNSKPLNNYDSVPPLVTQSPDRRWVLAEQPNLGGDSAVFDQYDTNDTASPIKQLALPPGVLTPSIVSDSTLSLVEWSSDNDHVILKHSFGDAYEFIIFNRSDPSSSININKLFKIDPSTVALRDKRIAQLYIYDSAKSSIQIGDTSSGQLAGAFLENVISFKPYGSSLIIYTTTKSAESGKVNVNIWDNGRVFRLTSLSSGSIYTIDTAQFQGHFYYVAASDTDEHIYIYKDPLDTLSNPAVGKAVPLLVFHLSGVTKAIFSGNSRFVEFESGQKFAVFDMETKSRYQYTVDKPLASALHWMDGHRLVGSSDGSILVMDYDSSNLQILGPSALLDGGYFSRNFNQLYSDRQATAQPGYVLEASDMRAGVDLPKSLNN